MDTPSQPDSLLSRGSHLSDPSQAYTFHTDLDNLSGGTTETALGASISSIHKISTLNLRHTVDLRAITYGGTVDENLVCPICRCPFVDPVLTDCDHVFCRACIDDALSHGELCPVDRLPLSQATIARAPKMVFNQLDALKAKCPCCGNIFARAILENHLEKYCLEAMVRCPGSLSEQGCTQVVKRRLSTQQCLHYPAQCPDCYETLEQIEMESHRQTLCRDRTKLCDYCEVEILRCEEIEHKAECPDVLQICKWAQYGCQHESKRRDLYLHADDCHFKSIGPMAEMLKVEISSLRDDVRNLTETNQLQERRIKFLESGQRASDRPMDLMDLSLASMPEAASTDSLDSGHDYLLSLLETQQSRLSHLSAELSDFQGKNTMMLFNETLPIKNELAELRSTQQVTCMHVRWLMRFRMQENQRRFGVSPGLASTGGPDGGNGFGSDITLSRRLSDSSRDVITKL
ncbi:RING/U-box [Glarea lozoyensis ATCC 20868]|uniref:RING/U-box n=1 Tax=Glarea lozoyensis (strain ATCC 20868 / MF5171) TaxID=1116229 RepID=S3DGQ0_GLAL2|nr:RING/U-box [Glarea lozoyensis ATCC 20868]EPE25768.1 RING/U-box [Glarea lozoyensis ATCC 20868]